MKHEIYSSYKREKVLQLDKKSLEELNRQGLDSMWESMISGNVDLHVHSNASDGKDSPAQVVHEIMRRNLDTFSLTDHDTIEGFKVISILYDKLNILGLDLPDFIPGIELNTLFEDKDIHILAYFPKGSFYLMENYIAERLAARQKRNQAMIDKANEIDINFEYKDLLSMGGGTIGRVHLAALLMKKGYADSNKEAFETYLDEGCPLFVPKELPSIEYTLKTIRDAGGVPVLGHLARYSNWLKGDNPLSKAELIDKVAKMKELGLQGIEVLHSEMTLAESRECASIGRELDLLPTAGSDYHGSHRPQLHLRTVEDDPRKFLSLFYEEFRQTKA